MNIFLTELSGAVSEDYIILVADGAAWHRSKTLKVPNNIEILALPPATPEMNPIEQIWREVRKRGFRNEIFQTLGHVIERLCETIRTISPEDIQSITHRDWIPCS
jgi:putative transposase